MQIGTSARRLAAVLGIGALLAGGTAFAQTADWQAGAGNNWRDVLAKAKAEGKVVVAGHPALSQPLSAGFQRDGRMMPLVDLHLLQYRPAFCVPHGQALEMALQMPDDLAFGFGDEPQTPFIATEPGHRPDGK